ncbi:MAG: NAD-dependent DNA ligase LigA, partial [Deltaproteobacteria bacterium]|nr:NAD-dependent DNA ligase LigA [Deltaproteobacteria bacterium]
EHIADILSTHFGSLERLQQADKEELNSINAVGPQIAESIISWLADESNRRLIHRLIEAGVRIESVSTILSSPITGKVFVITGTLVSMKRSEAKDLIIHRGGRLTSSIGKGTNYLVIGKSPGSKLQKAGDIGVPVLKEDEFIRLMEEV